MTIALAIAKLATLLGLGSQPKTLTAAMLEASLDRWAAASVKMAGGREWGPEDLVEACEELVACLLARSLRDALRAADQASRRARIAAENGDESVEEGAELSEKEPTVAQV